MLKVIKKREVRNLLPQRLKSSHKGQNGRILIVGGSINYHGAPILSALGALNSGADLVYLYVPESNFEACRSMYPDFIVKKFSGEFLSARDAGKIVEFGKKKADSVLIGPGLGDRESTVEGVKEIIENLHVPTVLDADAIAVIKKIEKFPLQQQIVVTPHQNEFNNLVDRDMKIIEDDPKSIILLRSVSMDLQLNVLFKGATDFVSSVEGVVETNITGNPGMTIGGSGDILAGIVASFLAQGLDSFDAARASAFINGFAGDLLRKQKGFCYTASDLAKMIPYAINKI